jgi:glycerol transport system ATP-binding protein
MLRPDSVPLPSTFNQPPTSGLQLGIRAHHIRVQRHHDYDIAIDGKVDLAEISGSDTYLHVAHRHQSLVAQLPGVHDFAIGATCTLFIDPANLYGFDAQGDALFTPAGV